MSRQTRQSGGVRHVHYTNCDKHGRQQVDAEQAKKGCKACELEARAAELEAKAAPSSTPAPAPEPFIEAAPTGAFVCLTHGTMQAPKGEQPHCPICRTEAEHGPIGEADDDDDDGDPPGGPFGSFDDDGTLDHETLTTFASLAVSLGQTMQAHGLALPASPARFALAVYRFLRTCEGSEVDGDGEG